MSLEQQIQSDIKAAMIAKDKVALAATRAVKAAILLAKTSEGGAKDSLEVEEAVKAIIAETGASSMADMGKVMGVATKKLAGQADGRLISTIVKKLLAQ